MELLQSVLLVCSTLDYAGDTALADIFQDGLDLVNGGRVFCDVELELLAVALCLYSVVASLVKGRS